MNRIKCSTTVAVAGAALAAGFAEAGPTQTECDAWLARLQSEDGTQADAERKALDFQVPPGGVHVTRVDKHMDYNLKRKEDWFNAIKTGQRPIMDIEHAHGTATLCILGNLSCFLGRKLQRDGARQLIIGDEFANRLLSRPQRYPYPL